MSKKLSEILKEKMERFNKKTYSGYTYIDIEDKNGKTLARLIYSVDMIDKKQIQVDLENGPMKIIPFSKTMTSDLKKLIGDFNENDKDYLSFMTILPLDMEKSL